MTTYTCYPRYSFTDTGTQHTYAVHVPARFVRRQGQLGFISTVGAIIGGVATAAEIGLKTYQTIESIEMAKEQQELQEDIIRQKAALEQELILTQKRIAEIQAAGVQERQAIQLDIEKAQAEALQRQLVRIEEIEEMRAAIEIAQLEKQRQAVEYAPVPYEEIPPPSQLRAKETNLLLPLGIAAAALLLILGLK